MFKRFWVEHYELKKYDRYILKLLKRIEDLERIQLQLLRIVNELQDQITDIQIERTDQMIKDTFKE